MATSRTVPWEELDTIFFDAGNTFLSMDFDRVAAVAAILGVECSGPQFERAEAAARPVLSAALAERRTTEGGGAFRFYLRATLERLPASSRDGVDLGDVVSGARRTAVPAGPQRSALEPQAAGAKRSARADPRARLSHGGGQQLGRQHGADRHPDRHGPSLRRSGRLDGRGLREAGPADLRGRARSGGRPSGTDGGTSAICTPPTSSAPGRPGFTPSCSTPGLTGRRSTARRWPIWTSWPPCCRGRRGAREARGGSPAPPSVLRGGRPERGGGPRFRRAGLPSPQRTAPRHPSGGLLRHRLAGERVRRAQAGEPRLGRRPSPTDAGLGAAQPGGGQVRRGQGRAGVPRRAPGRQPGGRCAGCLQLLLLPVPGSRRDAGLLPGREALARAGRSVRVGRLWRHGLVSGDDRGHGDRGLGRRRRSRLAGFHLQLGPARFQRRRPLDALRDALHAGGAGRRCATCSATRGGCGPCPRSGSC